jgi:protein-disulfide isomerase
MAYKAGRLESVMTLVVTLSAVSVAAMMAYRTFVVRDRIAAAPIPDAPPVRVKNWQKYLTAGIRTGPANAPITILEFADFECPFCKQFDMNVRNLISESPDAISLVFLHFPLDMHRFARPAARIAECAYDQGKFEEMRTLLFDKQDSLGLKPWIEYAKEAGLRDTASFARCAGDTTALPRVEEGLQLGREMRIRGTPTVLVNGWRYSHPPVLEELRRVTAALRQHQDPFR